MATTVSTGSPPALQQALPYILSGGSALLSAVSFLSRSLVSFISKAFRSILIVSPFSIVIYLLSPAFIFFEISLDIFILIPYQILLYVLDAFYPIYVFCGVACITGALIGISGKLLAKVLIDMTQNGYSWGQGIEVVEPRTEIKKKD